MTDSLLRTLERSQDGTVASEARLLAGRARAGQLAMVVPCPGDGYAECGRDFVRGVGVHALCAGTGQVTLQQGRLELAAYCGHPAARVATGWCCHWHSPLTFGRPVPPPVGVPEAEAWEQQCSSEPRHLHLWLQGLSRWGPTLLVRAAVAAGWVALEAWEGIVRTRVGLPTSEETARYMAARRALEAAEAWLACPCEEPHERLWREWWGIFGNPPPEIGRPGLDPWLAAWWPLGHHKHTETRVGEILAAADLAGEPAVREAMQRSLSAWALGQTTEGQ